MVRRGGVLPWSHVGLDLAAVDRGARPWRVRRVHRVECGLRCRMSSAVSKSWITTAVRWSGSWRIWTPLAGMSTGGPWVASTSSKRPAR